MTLDVTTLYQLLPAVYRLRDAAEGEPLRALLALVARELGAIEENLDQLYDDQFIETCAEWVAPYIGDLIGYRPLSGAEPRVASPRAEVANTIAYRRRKGPALMLEQLARDVTDWPARASELFEQLVTTQYMNHLRPQSLATAAVRSERTALTIDGPFNAAAHTPEMRPPESAGGRYNIPNVGIFLWRLQPFRLTALPIVHDPGDATGRRFRVNPLGADLRLFRHPRTEPDIDHLAGPGNVPAPLTVREFARQVRDATTTDVAVAASDDYGPSVVISRGGVDEPLRVAGAAPPDDLDQKRVVRIADLRDAFDGGGHFAGWAHENDIASHQIALDPERGRVLLGVDRVADQAAQPFTATFHYGFARPIGGGEYDRAPKEPADGAPRIDAANGENLQPHLDALAATGGRLLVHDSLTYAETPVFKIVSDPDGLAVIVGARDGARPVVAASGPVTLDIGAHGTLVLDGLVIAGGALRLLAAADNEPRTLVLRDCTLVPGLTLATNGDPASPGAPSLIVEHPFTTIQLDRCIVGPLRVVAESDVTVDVRDSIVDACAADLVAYAGVDAAAPGAAITLNECTVIGKLFARQIALASNCIFLARPASADPPSTAPVRVERRQEGCIRFSFVPARSITPRRHQCQPDADHPAAVPHFTSLRYGDPGYGQLRGVTAAVIREGASDGSEMGVLHALYQPQREANLRIRLEEYLRFGLHAGVFYAT